MELYEFQSEGVSQILEWERCILADDQGVGITLTAAATALFVEQSWVPALMTQAEDRIHRIGQKSSVMIWRVFVRNTLDEEVFKLLDRKEATIGKAIGKIKDRLIEEFFSNRYERDPGR